MTIKIVIGAVLLTLAGGIGYFISQVQYADTREIDQTQSTVKAESETVTQTESEPKAPVAQTKTSGSVDYKAPDLAGTLVTIDSSALRSSSGNPTLTGTAKAFTSLTIGITSNDRDGSASFSLKPVPVVDGRWSVKLVPSAFNHPEMGNTFNVDGVMTKGSYNIQIFGGPASVPSSLMNATLIVEE